MAIDLLQDNAGNPIQNTFRTAPTQTTTQQTPILTPNFQTSTIPDIGYNNPETQQYEQFRKVDPGQVMDAATKANNGYRLTSAPPATQQSAGNPEADFWNIYGKLPPSARTLEQYFPQFQALHPGWTLKKNASGYADAILGPNGEVIDTQINSGLDRSDAWQWSPANQGPGIPGINTSGYGAQFSDPSTKQFESYIKQYLDQVAAPVHDPAVDELLSYLHQRVTDLKQPAYTGAEQEILRTQALDPIENDRTAAQKRALDWMSSHGWGDTSGISADLMNQVNAGFDKSRASAQNDLAYKQIDEKRARDLDVQKLLGQQVSINDQLRQEEGQRRQTGLSLSSLLYELPQNAAQGAMAAIGQAGNPTDLFNSLVQLNSITQNNKTQNAAMWAQIGASFAPLLK